MNGCILAIGSIVDPRIFNTCFLCFVKKKLLEFPAATKRRSAGIGFRALKAQRKHAKHAKIKPRSLNASPRISTFIKINQSPHDTEVSSFTRESTMEDALEGYDDTNRAFLQALLARGSLDLDEGKELLAHIFTVKDERVTSKDDVTLDDLKSYIASAAQALSPFDYEIRSMRHQLSNKQTWALVNSASDPLTQLATTFTTEEMFYIKRLLDAMFETFNTKGKELMAITSTQAIHSSIIGGSGRQSIGDEDMQVVDNGVKRSDGERILSELIAQGWFERSERGYYSLTPRAILELRSWLIDTYNDSDDPDEWQPIKNCEACKGIVTVGLRCSKRDCIVRLHKICQSAYFNSRPNKNCPRCETEWDGKNYVGEKVVTSTEDNLREKRRSSASSRGRGAPVEEEEAEEEEQDEDENEQE